MNHHEPDAGVASRACVLPRLAECSQEGARADRVVTGFAQLSAQQRAGLLVGGDNENPRRERNSTQHRRGAAASSSTHHPEGLTGGAS